MEVIDIVDKDLNIVRTGKRGENLKRGEFFKFIHIWIIVNNKVLIQKRGYDRMWAAGKWATHTGVVSASEDEKQCAKREVEEEMGISLNLDDIELGFVITPKNYFTGIGFIYFAKINECDIKIDNKEVIDYMFVEINELKRMIRNRSFIDYGRRGKDYDGYFANVFNKISMMMEV